MTLPAPAHTLVQIDAGPWQIARGDKRTPRAYEVHTEDGLVGVVRNQSRESWRKSGRIRTSLIGYSYEWSYEATDRSIRGDRYTRRDAIAALLHEVSTRNQQPVRS